MPLLSSLLLLCIMAGGADADWHRHVPPRLHALSRHLLAAKPGPPAKVAVKLSIMQNRTRVVVQVWPPAGASVAGLRFNITGYPNSTKLPRLVASGAGTSVAGSNQRQFTIAGHQRNVVYRFTARAINGAGAGPEKLPRVLFYECDKKYFTDTGTGCKCKVSSTGCRVKSADGCSCKTCSNQYKASGTGSCSKCPAIARCTSYSTATCACTACNQYFSGGACTCSMPSTGCAKKNVDGCSCATCSNGYKGNGKGGCQQCPAVANCKTYSGTDCRCTACNQYFGAPTLGACKCTVPNTGCATKNTDGCSCKACSSGYMPDGIGGCKQCKAITNCKPFSYSTIDCSCTQCNAGYGSCSPGSPCATNLQTNSSHCGGCNKPCTSGRVCQSGVCGCPAGKYLCNGVCIANTACCTATSASCPPSNSNCKCTSKNSVCPQDGGLCECSTGSSWCTATASCHVFAARGTLPLGAECCPEPLWGNECQRSDDAYATCKAGVCAKVIGLPMATGSNSIGQLGDGSWSSSSLPVSVAAEGSAAKATLLAVGSMHSCVAVNFGAEPAMCWGYNLFGQLGDNTYSDRGTPAVVTGAYTNFKLIAAGDRHTCGVLATSNRLACWGYGYNYQLGTGATIDLAQPALVSDGGTATYRSVACGFGHTCALRTDDRIVCFGLNADGQSGDATFKDVQTPTLVAGAFKRVVAGTSHSCALRTSDGHALCWGSGPLLGGGTGTGRIAEPQEVAGGLEFTQLAAGDFHTCGIVAGSGAAYCWGYNDEGALGNGSNFDSLEPVPVLGGLAFADIAAGSGHTCGLLNNGSVACWGWNDAGQLGDGSNTDRLTPTLVDNGRTFTAVAAGLGSSHTLFLP